jgi:hypothetical protein
MDRQCPITQNTYEESVCSSRETAACCRRDMQANARADAILSAICITSSIISTRTSRGRVSLVGPSN